MPSLVKSHVYESRNLRNNGFVFRWTPITCPQRQSSLLCIRTQTCTKIDFFLLDLIPSVGPHPMPSTAKQPPELRVLIAIDSKRKLLTRRGLLLIRLKCRGRYHGLASDAVRRSRYVVWIIYLPKQRSFRGPTKERTSSRNPGSNERRIIRCRHGRGFLLLGDSLVDGIS